jgi:hypothetical protein
VGGGGLFPVLSFQSVPRLLVDQQHGSCRGVRAEGVETRHPVQAKSCLYRMQRKADMEGAQRTSSMKGLYVVLSSVLCVLPLLLLRCCQVQEVPVSAVLLPHRRTRAALLTTQPCVRRCHDCGLACWMHRQGTAW